MAHIGVIEELLLDGYTIKEIAGSSMGAIVGGIYAAGYLPEYKHWLIRLSRMDVFRLLDFTLSGQGFVKGERVFKAMEEFIGDLDIESLPIPFTAVATDITNQKEVYYKTGSLFKALRASVAIPTILTPVVENNRMLIDGGVMNPLPLNVVTREPGDLVVAVNLNGPVKEQATTAEESIKPPYQKLFDSLLATLGRTEAEQKVKQLGFFDLMNRSYDLTQDRVTELMINLHKPDLVINIPRDVCGVFEFYRANEVIDIGRKAYRSVTI